MCNCVVHGKWENIDTVYKLSSYVIENSLHLRCRGQLVNPLSEIISLHSEFYTKIPLCLQSLGVLNVKPCGNCSNHWNFTAVVLVISRITESLTKSN